MERVSRGKVEGDERRASAMLGVNWGPSGRRRSMPEKRGKFDLRACPPRSAGESRKAAARRRRRGRRRLLVVEILLLLVDALRPRRRRRRNRCAGLPALRLAVHLNHRAGAAAAAARRRVPSQLGGVPADPGRRLGRARRARAGGVVGAEPRGARGVLHPRELLSQQEVRGMHLFCVLPPDETADGGNATRLVVFSDMNDGPTGPPPSVVALPAGLRTAADAIAALRHTLGCRRASPPPRGASPPRSSPTAACGSRPPPASSPSAAPCSSRAASGCGRRCTSATPTCCPIWSPRAWRRAW